MSEATSTQVPDTVVPAAPNANGAEEAKGMSLYSVAGISAFVALAVCVSAIATYHSVFSQQQRFGTVDISSIMDASELRFTEILAKRDMSEVDRLKALDEVRQVGPKLDAAIGLLQQECRCILLAKPAVMGDAVADYTERIRGAVGVASLDVEATQARIREALRPTKAEGSKP